MKNKICPMKIGNICPDLWTKYKEKCAEENCAWWSNADKVCAIVGINLRQLRNAVEVETNFNQKEEK